MTVQQGFNTHCNVNGCRKAVRSWRVEDAADDNDSSTTEDLGFGNGVTGVETCTITLTFQYDPTEPASATLGNAGPGTAVVPGNPFNAPLNLFVRSRCAVRIFVDPSGARFWDFPVAEVISTPMDAESRGLENETVTLRSRGAYTQPIG